MENYFLYLDESGQFKDQTEASLIGGILFKQQPKELTNYIIQKNLIAEDEDFHSAEANNPGRQISILNELKSKSVNFVIFQNSDRIQLMNSDGQYLSDRLYLNVLSYGLIKLLEKISKDLKNKKFSLYVTIATRQIDKIRETSQEKISYSLEEYLNILIDRLILKNENITISPTVIDGEFYTKIENNQFCLNINRKCIAREKNKLLMCADVVCNTYFTRKTGKFKKYNINEIESLYKKEYLISSFTENDTISYLEHLLSTDNYSEILLELISLKTNSNSLDEFIKKFINKFNNLTTAEQELNLEYISKRISLEDNLELILNYKKFVETFFSQNNFLKFDSCFHLTTKYSHIGDIINANKTLQLCKKELSGINKSWDKISYYFNFNIREISLLIDMFKFDDALKQVTEFYNKVSNVYKTLDLQSNILAKVSGVKVRIYLNLLRNHPEYLEEARKASDSSINEFSTIEDKRLQYQFRCLLENEAKYPDEAFKYLSLSLDCKQNIQTVINKIDELKNESKIDATTHNLMHYTNIMINYKTNTDKSDFAEQMYTELKRNNNLYQIVTDINIRNNPQLLSFWNCAKYLLYSKEDNSLYKLILDNVKTGNLIRDSLLLCIFADYISFQLNNNNENRETREYIRKFKDEYKKFLRSQQLHPDVERYFNLDINFQDISKDISKLKELSIKYLR